VTGSAEETDETRVTAVRGVHDAATSHGDLPAFLTRFIGRRAELTELADLLAARRLLTISGAGGCGKSRLAREALSDHSGRWIDGVRWVALESVTDPSRVPAEIAAAIGLLVDPAAGPRRALVRGICDRHLVVCLDNCEHLLDACAPIVEEMLSACPNLTVLATSREPIGVAGETVWRVPSLPDTDAMALFADRARGVRPDFGTDVSNESAVRTVCRRLDAGSELVRCSGTPSTPCHRPAASVRAPRCKTPRRWPASC
jgi:predicted ATPase